MPGLKPHVEAAKKEIAATFDVSDIGGYSYRNIAGTDTLSDHALGLALDVMIHGDNALGEKVAAWAQANASRLGITYIIYNRRIWSVQRSKEGWRAYGGANPHTDHVHLSFSAKGGDSTAPNIESAGLGLDDIPGPIGLLSSQLKAIYDAVSGFNKIAAWIANPHNWFRIAVFAGGAALLLVGLFSWDNVKSAVTTTSAKVVNNAS